MHVGQSQPSSRVSFSLSDRRFRCFVKFIHVWLVPMLFFLHLAAYCIEGRVCCNCVQLSGTSATLYRFWRASGGAHRFRQDPSIWPKPQGMEIRHHAALLSLLSSLGLGEGRRWLSLPLGAATDIGECDITGRRARSARYSLSA